MDNPQLLGVTWRINFIKYLRIDFSTPVHFLELEL